MCNGRHCQDSYSVYVASPFGFFLVWPYYFLSPLHCQHLFYFFFNVLGLILLCQFLSPQPTTESLKKSYSSCSNPVLHRSASSHFCLLYLCQVVLIELLPKFEYCPLMLQFDTRITFIPLLQVTLSRYLQTKAWSFCIGLLPGDWILSEWDQYQFLIISQYALYYCKNQLIYAYF